MTNNTDNMNYSYFFGIITSFMFFAQPQARTNKSILKMKKMKKEIENAQLADAKNRHQDWERIYGDIEKSFNKLTSVDR